MNRVSFEDRLLSLHYVLPVPLNRIQPLLNESPDLTAINMMTVHQLSSLLKLSNERTIRFKKMFEKALTTPFRQAYQKYDIIPIPYTHKDYPSMLFELNDPPAVLYAKGKTELLQKMKIAVIGSRKATAYTEKVMHYIVPPLVQHDIVIVSGLAKGADTMAHKSSIQYGGETIAVLGSGFFHIYPRENIELARQISTDHLIITEYPPYLTPQKWHFPMRNRIISGLSKGVVVTEAAQKSGTVSTMEHALEHGKEIFVVPGPITSELSLGPHILLNEGAKPVWNGYQIVEEILP